MELTNNNVLDPGCNSANRLQLFRTMRFDLFGTHFLTMRWTFRFCFRCCCFWILFNYKWRPEEKQHTDIMKQMGNYCCHILLNGLRIADDRLDWASSLDFELDASSSFPFVGSTILYRKCNWKIELYKHKTRWS